jgi:beta-lactamase regulating signal transducer with metallopeptidase domain
MLIGIFQPAIILPQKMLGACESSILESEHIKYVLMHELSHYKRKDILYKWLIQIIACVHFFNPFMGMIKRSINKMCELSCDEAVIRKLHSREKKSYGSALIKAMEMSNGIVIQNSPPAALSLMMCEEAKQTQERLDSILGYKKHSALMIIAAAILTVFIIFCTVHIGVFRNIFRTASCYCFENIR